jgi:diaminopimelate epimerase
MSRAFVKMHGLGNDFVVLDARTAPLSLSRDEVRLIADRRRGVGCDQLLVLEPAQAPGAAAFMRIYNADGGEVNACGNGSRAVGALLLEETRAARVFVDTAAGRLEAWRGPDGNPTVDMGKPGLVWNEIPLARDVDTLTLPLSAEGVHGVGVSMGNPHGVFFVPDCERVDVAKIGPALERDPLFPERANIEFATVKSRDEIRMRVWERGAGVTQACGTGACATLVAAVRRGLTDRRARLVLDGGVLTIEWRDDDHVTMSGPVVESFRGVLSDAILPSRRDAQAA